ncbi:hypothetical protein EMN47_00215 [Prolixibacteraceae bacterium JC049]|nr:hypothetical protein [Prolixibacteraceae bacterium JC049]
MNRAFLLFVFSFIATNILAQVSAPTANFVGNLSDLNYSVFVFNTPQNATNGALQAQFPGGETASFKWQKLNLTSGTYEDYADGGNGSSSSIDNLANGQYKVIADNGTETREFLAAVINNWHTLTASIQESTCDNLKLNAEFTAAPFEYINSSNAKVQLVRNPKVGWKAEDVKVSSKLTVNLLPPYRNTTYKIEVTDQFELKSEASVDYTSIVPKALFAISPNKGDAPLSVEFTNNSENADSFTWSFYKSEEQITKEREDGTYSVPQDSIESEANNSQTAAFERVYDETGNYRVKLTARKGVEPNQCEDILYYKFIAVNPSEIDIPWAFSPDSGNEENKTFYVRAKSMKSLEINIFNRWGRNIHNWKSSRINANDQVSKESVWDGKIGGTMASPGVYYYVVKAVGADDKKYEKKGFVHLFRGKN